MRRIDLDTWEEILITITRNKTRSILTAFGVFWGIFMLIALMGGAQGMKDLISRQFEGFATNSGFMAAMKTGKAYKGFQQGRVWEMTNQDVTNIRQRVPGIDVVTPTLDHWGVNIIYNGNKISGSLKGHYPAYDRIEEPRITMGRSLNDMDIKGCRKVCVIGKQVYETLFPDKSNPCGKYVLVDGNYYQIIGVNEASGNISINGDTETSIILPFTTVQRNYNHGDKINMLCYTARRGYAVSEVEKLVQQVIRQAHFIHPQDEQAVMSLNAEAMFGMMENLFSGIRILSWLVGLGTLLAGAIGVSNIMMVTVKERTTEIGIRRAIGARPSDILQQVLSESMILTLVAGMAGISFAVFLLNGIEQITSAQGTAAHFQISFAGALGACILVMLLGLLAGLAPAYRAMAIKPIEAIRDE